MGVKKFIKKSVAFVAATAMALTMVVVPVGAGEAYAEETGSTTNDPVHVNKTAELQSDGTYKITLESWAEGSATTTTTKSGTPLDIVLVLDQSGSMKDSGKLEALKSAVTTFVDNVEKNAKEYNVDHRIAIAGYASNKTDGKSNSGTISSGSSNSNWVNTGLFINGKLKNYETESGYNEVYEDDLDTSKTYYVYYYGSYKEATYNGSNWGYYDWRENWTSITPKTSSNDNNWQHTQVYEYTEGGSLTAQDYRDSLVNVNTNGSVTSSIKTAISNIAASGATRTQYGMEMANQVFANNPITNTNRKRIVVVFTDGQPGKSGYDSTEASSAVNKAYTTKNTHGATVYTIGCYSSGEDSDNRVTNFMNYLSSNYPNAKNMSTPGTAVETKKYYQTTSDASELTKIFENLSDEVTTGSTTATLSDKSIVRDLISDNFELPTNFTEGNVEAYTSVYKGNGDWETPEKMTNAKVEVNKNNKTIDVSGFPYDKEYTTEKAVQDKEGLGKKFIVVISNVTATKAGMQMDTNTDSSAIYNPDESGELALVKAFPQPKVDIDSTSYVLDYGKTVTTAASDYGVSAVTKANTGKPSPYNVELKGAYGTFAINGNDLDYTPGKINWDGIDTGYVFGQKSDSKYKWEEVNFMPASSVYYEDDFAQTTNSTDSNVKIIWAGDWTEHGTSKNNNQSSANIQYGWDNIYDNETGYSNGSVHAAYTKGATAKFTFTGTGVDIYSRTDGVVGQVYAKLTGSSKANKDVIIRKGLNVKNKSDSGTYYQIPTLSFDNLEYGTYTVKLTVLGNSTSENKEDGTAAYYLDGIRVYNPLGKVNDLSTTEGKAYDKAGELNAKYIKVRDILIDAKTLEGKETFDAIKDDVSGTVFIDRIKNTNGTTTDKIGTFEDLGPKNEVYLKNGQGIVFNVEDYDSNANLFIGLKAMSGTATTVQVTNGTGRTTKNINSANDLYYTITPDKDGNVVIKNTGTGLLSITKVRITTKSSSANTYSLRVTPNAMSYAKTFDSLPLITEDKTEDKSDKDTTLGKDDVEIENPSDSNSDENQSTSNNFWNNVLNNLKKWFGR